MHEVTNEAAADGERHALPVQHGAGVKLGQLAQDVHLGREDVEHAQLRVGAVVDLGVGACGQVGLNGDAPHGEQHLDLRHDGEARGAQHNARLGASFRAESNEAKELRRHSHPADGDGGAVGKALVQIFEDVAARKAA